MKKGKLIRLTTIPISLKKLLEGQLDFISKNGFEVIAVSSQGKDLEDVHKQEGVAIVPLEMTRIISPIRDIKSLWSFYRLCKREKPLIVHSHTPKAGIVGMLGAKFAGVPIRLHTVAGLPLMEATGVKRKLLDFVEKLTYALATKVYPNSKVLYEFILSNNYTSDKKLKVIANGSSNGINMVFFNPEQVSPAQQNHLKNELNINEDDFVFIFVGRLVGDKGINELVKAFVNKRKYTKSPNCKLLLVGSFELELDPLKQETLNEIKKNENIISVGFQNDVRPYLAISNALVFPSYREGFPNVVMQAGAMGLPSIVSDINGCNEIIIEGVNGYIVPVKSSDALLEAMDAMVNNKDHFDTLKANARQMIQSRYEQSIVWKALLEEYNYLISKFS